MKKANALKEEELWVVCPVCGTKIMRARRADADEICEVCGNTITIYATKWFVTTIVNDDEQSFTERMLRYQKELALLTN